MIFEINPQVAHKSPQLTVKSNFWFWEKNILDLAWVPNTETWFRSQTMYYYTKIDLPMQLLPDATDAKIRVEFQLKNMNHQRIRELLAIPNLHFASEVINEFCNQSK